jgi:hypothetical protein
MEGTDVVKIGASLAQRINHAVMTEVEGVAKNDLIVGVSLWLGSLMAAEELEGGPGRGVALLTGMTRVATAAHTSILNSFMDKLLGADDPLK